MTTPLTEEVRVFFHLEHDPGQIIPGGRFRFSNTAAVSLNARLVFKCITSFRDNLDVEKASLPGKEERRFHLVKL